MADNWDNKWAQIKRDVEETMKRDRMQVRASTAPIGENGMRTGFPVNEVTTASLKVQTIKMRADRTRYRFVPDPWIDVHEDVEASVTLQLWRELQGLHHHVETVGELHMFNFRWNGVSLQIPVISLHGGEEARDQHPSTIQVKGDRRGLTSGNYPCNLMRVMGYAPVEGVSLVKRYVFYLTGARELIKDMSLDEFVGVYQDGERLKSLINFLGGGRRWIRPTLSEAKLDDFELIRETRGSSADTSVPPPPSTPASSERSVVSLPSGSGSSGRSSLVITRTLVSGERPAKRHKADLQHGHDIMRRLMFAEDNTTQVPRGQAKSGPPGPLTSTKGAQELEDLTEEGKSKSDDKVKDDSHVSAMSVDSYDSPRGELSNAFEDNNKTGEELLEEENKEVSLIDLTCNSTASEDNLSFSPFLAKPAKDVVTVGSSSSEDDIGKSHRGEKTKSPKPDAKEDQDDSVIIEEPSEEKAERGGAN